MQAVLAEAGKGKFKEGELLVRFKDGTSQATIVNVHKAVGATVIKSFSNVANLQLVKLPAGFAVQDTIGIYMADANVQYAEPNYIYSLSAVPNDLYFAPQQWALQNTGAFAYGTAGADIRATGAWDISTGSRSVTAAVLDTGIDYTHPDLVGNMWADRVKVLLQDMHWLGHDTFKIVGEKVIYTDPFNIRAPLPTVPETDRADIILISHNHQANCSPADVFKVKGPNTVVVTTADCAQTLRQDPTHPFTGDIRTVQPGSSLTVGGIDITAVPAYNLEKADHPRANGWVGFVFTVNRNRDIAPSTEGPQPAVDLNQEPGPRIYFAGGTDRIPEMAAAPIKGADVAILPVSGPDVMSATDAVLAAFDIRPKVAVPMHFGTGSAADARKLADDLQGKIEVAIMTDQSAGYTMDTISFDNNQKIDDWRGWNFIDDSNDPWDDNGHGTHVAGIIGATGNNGLGIAGINWRVELMPLKVCDSSGMCPDDAIIDAIGYAVFKGVKIVNASLGGFGTSFAMRDTIVAAGQAGTLLIASAGNGNADHPGDGIGDNNDVNPVFPASFVLDNVISVAATDQNDRRTSFSNFGLQTVHVAAPGQYILSTVPTSLATMTFITDWCTGSPFAGYNICDGTSMAAPHVTGLAALLASVYPNFTYSQIRGMIIKYVDKQPTLEGWIFSGGRINAQSAITSLLQPTGLTASALSTSQVSLSWHDNSGEDAYAIERKQPDGSFITLGVVGQNVTSFTDSGLSSGTSYTYRIKAGSNLPNPPNRYTVSAESAPSAEATVVTPGQAGGSTSGGGGGGGCSVGRTRTGSANVADVFAMLAPLVAIIVMRNLRRKKR